MQAFPKPDADERSWQLRLSVLLRQVRELSDGLDPLVAKYELKSSEFLFGLIGALIFLLLSLVLGPQIINRLGIQAVPLILAAAILLGIGLGLSLFRGPSRWRMERNLRRLGLQLEVLRGEVKLLDGLDNIPQDIRGQLWTAYEETIEAYRQLQQFSYRASNYPFVLLGRRRS